MLMSLLLTFMELDKLYESNQHMSRDAIVKELKELGKDYYNFEKWSDANLFSMLEKARKAKNEEAGMREYHNLVQKEQARLCKKCGNHLTDGGQCRSCSADEADYAMAEDLFEWIDAAGTTINNVTSSGVPTSQPSANAQQTKAGGNVVTIVYDNTKHKLRAQTDDGIHGKGYVAFPNNLRTAEGQQYEVETITWNGKNYRVSGNIKPI